MSENQHTEGGATPTMGDTQMISQETHDALLRQRIDDAVRASDQALQAQTDKANAAESRVTELETELTAVKQENTELNSKLDESQVKVNSLTEENAQLKEDADKAAKQKELDARAAERAAQVKNLGLFPEDYVKEKASIWATKSDEDWAEQVESWKQLKPAAADAAKATDTASSMTGGDETLTATTDTATKDETKTSSRRAVLGLT